MSDRWAWANDFMNTRLGRLILGIIKMALAGLLISLVNAFSSFSINITIGDQTYDLTVVLQIIIAFFPLFLMLSAMRDIGIKL
ncbi:MAG: hypothetical protein J7K21_05435 [Desulfurococcales archaeon]|nr:hypothetical protein [Desulfurococcales archaeon]